jgi:hypothetical protein
MHWEKASSWPLADCPAFADPPALGEPPGLAAEPVDDGLPLQAAGRTTAAPTMMAAAVRAAGGHARRGRRMTRMPWFIMGFMPAVLRRGG